MCKKINSGKYITERCDYKFTTKYCKYTKTRSPTCTPTRISDLFNYMSKFTTDIL